MFFTVNKQGDFALHLNQIIFHSLRWRVFTGSFLHSLTVFKSFGTIDFFSFLAAFNIIANLCLGDCWSQLQIKAFVTKGKIILFKTGLEGKKIRSEQLLYIVLNGLSHLLTLHLCGGRVGRSF